MPQIPIEKAKEGMVIKEKVINDKGMVLLHPGSVLSEMMIARLKKWNVQSVICEGAANGGETDASSGEDMSMALPVMNAEQEKRLNERFKPVLDDPIMKEIYEGVKVYFQKAGQQEAKPSSP
ncbi:MAG: hypothetical protein JW774_12050 [Candidatus Aureabacteria bacterium]|nr:hypothetical protein [Candidatus Auribacterota bacterium]